ncbi:MAG TPA: transporter, partial [Pirellulales bacterium]
MSSSTAGPEAAPGSEEYVHIRSTDVWDPNRFWYTDRPNIFNQAVPDDWDAMKLINTDRPDFTDVATVVGKGVTQIETGYTYNYLDDHTMQVQSQSFPESLLRYGTSDRFEWRMKWLGYLDNRTVDAANGAALSQSGGSDLTVGFKWIAITQDNWRPLQSIVTRLGVPLGSTNFSADTIEPGISYICNWQVRK